jgi:SAM-dependent methyltransferase
MGTEILNAWETPAPFGAAANPIMPNVPIRFGHARLGYRWSRYLGWSLRKRHLPGVRDALAGLGHLTLRTAVDTVHPRARVVCNVCGWSGSAFFPNVGSGYYERDASCPRCSCIHRYRTLAAVLERATDFFSPDKAVIEVAPVRSFQAYCLWRKQGRNYRSFDLERFGMERGDLTAMRYPDASCDYFLCYHVLEHVPADTQALAEICRVLRPGGTAVLQVPIDWSLSENVEYGRPNERETGHVRRYAEAGFTGRIAAAGFVVAKVEPARLVGEALLSRHRLSREPIYFAHKLA